MLSSWFQGQGGCMQVCIETNEEEGLLAGADAADACGDRSPRLALAAAGLAGLAVLCAMHRSADTDSSWMREAPAKTSVSGLTLLDSDAQVLGVAASPAAPTLPVLPALPTAPTALAAEADLGLPTEFSALAAAMAHQALGVPAATEAPATTQAPAATAANQVKNDALELACSDLNGDCRQSQCCKSPGQTCFEKNEFWATCQDDCAPGVRAEDEDQEPWTCRALGHRTTFPAGCTWAGEDCSQATTCCNLGFMCLKKDEYWTSCMQKEQGPWDNLGKPQAYVATPAGWNGTHFGDWRSEWELEPAPGAPLATTSLFCFMAVMADGPERALVDVARRRQAGIFGCDAYKLFNAEKSEWKTWDTGQKTLVNTGAFVKIWDQVKQGIEYLEHDWTVKVDADCVFFPDRLRSHLAGLQAPAHRPIYIKNAPIGIGASNGGFLGAIEILSKTAVETYLDNAQECIKNIGLESGEDGYMKECMDALGIAYMRDELMMHSTVNPTDCQVKEIAAFHPIKIEGNWAGCYEIAMGHQQPIPMNTGSVNLLPPVLRPSYMPTQVPPS
mmetsp:Transcript_20043/g.69581  ORF Transcript_20043/g.69581 Transcript_20043/m.69581 type:complete len:558 (+) Transcript_20043:79-1752(+)